MMMTEFTIERSETVEVWYDTQQIISIVSREAKKMLLVAVME